MFDRDPILSVLAVCEVLRELARDTLFDWLEFAARFLRASFGFEPLLLVPVIPVLFDKSLRPL